MYSSTFLKKKTALITGASSGIGESISRKLSGEGIKVILVARRKDLLANLAEALVDADPNRPGIQEVKQWVGLMEYVRSFKDTDGDGYPEIPEKYRGKLGRTVREPSLNPALLLKGGTYMTWIGFTMVVLVVAIVAVVSVVVVKKVRK